MGVLEVFRLDAMTELAWPLLESPHPVEANFMPVWLILLLWEMGVIFPVPLWFIDCSIIGVN